MHIQEYIDQIPKAELHLHIEGSFEPKLMFEIARRNGIDIPYAHVDELKAAYAFDCLQDFLDIYHQGAAVLQQEQDFYDLTLAYLRRVSRDQVRHAEIMIDTQTHTDRGVPIEYVLHGISRACDDAHAEFGISSLLILSFLRHLSEEDAFQTLSNVLPFRDLITAVGLASSEIGHPPSKFKRIFEKAVALGFVPVAHAGEEGPPEYIWEAIDELNVVRIDHGNRCLEDERLVDEIISRDLALTVCPLSNTALCVVDDMKDHPLQTMLKRGLKVTINSDDPAYFGGYINTNFIAAQKALALDKEEVYQLVRNSFTYSLLPEIEKEKHLTEVDAFHRAHG